ncbi:retrotransposable element ORF2 protein [Plecturocebus cupreus]
MFSICVQLHTTSGYTTKLVADESCEGQEGSRDSTSSLHFLAPFPFRKLCMVGAELHNQLCSKALGLSQGFSLKKSTELKRLWRPPSSEMRKCAQRALLEKVLPISCREDKHLAASDLGEDKKIRHKKGLVTEEQPGHKVFIMKTPKAIATIAKIVKWDLIKLKHFCTAKETIIRVDRQLTE